jgi:hypothetical protein
MSANASGRSARRRHRVFDVVEPFHHGAHLVKQVEQWLERCVPHGLVLANGNYASEWFMWSE